VFNRLINFKATKTSAAIASIAQLSFFFFTVFVYLALDNSETVIVIAVLIGFPLFLLSSFFFVFGIPLKPFEKAMYIRMLCWSLSGGILINVVSLLAMAIG
tara:strand:+ start:63 stop:365 length:303 start_codon:yes stop_codon:yes gene_type:complete